MKSKIGNIFFAICLPIVILLFSFGCYIFDSKYYVHFAKEIDLGAELELTDEELAEDVYEPLMKYCVWGGVSQKSVQKYLQEPYFCDNDRAHMIDVRRLFLIAQIIFFASLIFLVTYAVLKIKREKLYGLFKLAKSALIGFLFFGILIALLLLVASLDFDKAFTVFHQIFFFYDKEQLWLMSWDEMVKYLPQDIFFNIATTGFIIALSLIAVVFGWFSCRNKNLQKEDQSNQ